MFFAAPAAVEENKHILKRGTITATSASSPRSWHEKKTGVTIFGVMRSLLLQEKVKQV